MSRKISPMFGMLLVSALCLTSSFAASESEESDSLPEDMPFLTSPQGVPILSLAGRYMANKRTSQFIDPMFPPVIRSLRINTTVQYRFAQTSLCTTIHNPSTETQEITFNQAVPQDALISGFFMELDGERHSSTLRKDENTTTEEYQSIYEYKEVATHINARDSKLFSLPVDVKANQDVTFCFSYEEVLTRALNYRVPIHITPNSIVNELQVRVHIIESAPFNNLEITNFLSENEKYTPHDKLPPAACQSEVSYILVNCISSSEVEILYAPTEVDQKRIIKAYKKSKSEEYLYQALPVNRKSLKSFLPSLGLNGRFEIYYDTERKDVGGEILHNDKYFVHYFGSPQGYKVNKHLIIVVDTHGYDSDSHFMSVKSALATLLENNLNTLDFINIIEVSENVKLYNFDEPENSLDYPVPFGRSDEVTEEETTHITEDETTTTETPQEEKVIDDDDEEEEETLTENKVAYKANKDNIATAKNIIFRMKRSTKAHTLAGLQVAVRCAQNCKTYTGRILKRRTIVLPTILYVTTGKQPNVGAADMAAVINTVTVENMLGANAQIFALGVGSSSGVRDEIFDSLSNLTMANNGFYNRIYFERMFSGLKDGILSFYKRMSTPQLSNIIFDYNNRDKMSPVVTKSKFRTVYWGAEKIVAGEFPEGKHPKFLARIQGGLRKDRNITEVVPKATKIEDMAAIAEDEPVIERIWAHLKIKDLVRRSNEEFLRDQTLFGTKSENDSWIPYNEEAKRLSHKYELLTPLTSLVVIPGEKEVFELDIINPILGQEQVIANLLRKEFEEVYRTRWEMASRMLNVTWLNGMQLLPEYVALPLGQDGENRGYSLAWTNEDPDPLEECSTKSTPTKNGTCKFLVNCVLPEIQDDIQTFKKYKCNIGNTNYLAICCPEDHGSK